jgi:hypothetical protein
LDGEFTRLGLQTVNEVIKPDFKGSKIRQELANFSAFEEKRLARNMKFEGSNPSLQPMRGTDLKLV